MRFSFVLIDLGLAFCFASVLAQANHLAPIENEFRSAESSILDRLAADLKADAQASAAQLRGTETFAFSSEVGLGGAAIATENGLLTVSPDGDVTIELEPEASRSAAESAALVTGPDYLLPMTAVPVENPIAIVEVDVSRPWWSFTRKSGSTISLTVEADAATLRESAPAREAVLAVARRALETTSEEMEANPTGSVRARVLTALLLIDQLMLALLMCVLLLLLWFAFESFTRGAGESESDEVPAPPSNDAENRGQQTESKGKADGAAPCGGDKSCQHEFACMQGPAGPVPALAVPYLGYLGLLRPDAPRVFRSDATVQAPADRSGMTEPLLSGHEEA